MEIGLVFLRDFAPKKPAKNRNAKSFCPKAKSYRAKPLVMALSAYYKADVLTANDYYPFGMQMPGRKFSISSSYRYGLVVYQTCGIFIESIDFIEF
jgi:hypothetical protein